MIKLTNLLKEIIDIYSPEELDSNGADGNVRIKLYNYYLKKTLSRF